MSDAENILKENEFFTDTVDKPMRGIKQHLIRDCLKVTISKGKLLSDKKQRMHSTVDKTRKKVYPKYKQRELNEKGRKREKACN